MFNVGGVLFIRTETAPIRGEHMGFPNSLVGKESTAMQEKTVYCHPAYLTSMQSTS